MKKFSYKKTSRCAELGYLGDGGGGGGRAIASLKRASQSRNYASTELDIISSMPTESHGVALTSDSAKLDKITLLSMSRFVPGLQGRRVNVHVEPLSLDVIGEILRIND